MLRPFFLSTAACLALTGCQIEQQVQTNTPEQRLAMSAEVLQTCARSECGRLDLDSHLVADYAAAIPLTHVTALMASWSNFNNDDLAKIAQMGQLRELHIGSTQVTDIRALPNLSNLTLLHLQWNRELRDFTPISRLSNLQELALGGNTVGDLAYLRGLRNLTGLSLANADISSLEGLRGHPSLQALDLEDATLPEDLSVLRTIPNLKTVTISDWNLDDSQRAVLDQLSADGVEVTRQAVVIVC